MKRILLAAFLYAPFAALAQQKAAPAKPSQAPPAQTSIAEAPNPTKEAIANADAIIKANTSYDMFKNHYFRVHQVEEIVRELTSAQAKAKTRADVKYYGTQISKFNKGRQPK